MGISFVKYIFKEYRKRKKNGFFSKKKGHKKSFFRQKNDLTKQLFPWLARASAGKSCLCLLKKYLRFCQKRDEGIKAVT